jgi:hypothetical protein
MKLWFVLEANNCDTDIWISDSFDSQESAQKYLMQRYNENVDDIGENVIEEKEYQGSVYSILTFGSEYYYGVVRSIDIKEVS